jgi:hypothetical protein
MKGTVRSAGREAFYPIHRTSPAAMPNAITTGTGPRDCHGCASARVEAACRNVLSAARLSSMCQS